MKRGLSLACFAALALSMLIGNSAHAASRGGTSYLGFQMLGYSGGTEKSLSESYGYGVTFYSTPNAGIIRPLMGGSFVYSPAIAYVNDTQYSGILYSADMMFGFIVTPMNAARIRPFFSVAGLVGLKSIQLSSAPTGADTQTMALSTGYKGAFGFEFELRKSMQVNVSIEYIKNTATSLVGESGFVLDALGFAVGLTL